MQRRLRYTSGQTAQAKSITRTSRRLTRPKPSREIRFRQQDASAALQTLAEKDFAFKKRKADAAKAKEKADKDAEAARIKRENCDRARSNLAALDQGGRTYTSGPNGERNYMTDQQRADARADAQRYMAENCR